MFCFVDKENKNLLFITNGFECSSHININLVNAESRREALGESVSQITALSNSISDEVLDLPAL